MCLALGVYPRFSRIALYFKGWSTAARSRLHAIAESTAGAQAGEGERRQIILPSYMHGCTPEVHERVDHDAICPLTPPREAFCCSSPPRIVVNMLKYEPVQRHDARRDFTA